MKAFSVFGSRKSGEVEAVKETASTYYLKLARRVKFVKFSVALLIVLFIPYAFTANKNQMTINNLRYMLKYIDFTRVETSTGINTIVFDHDEKSVMELLRDNTVVLDGSGITVYDTSGQRTLAESFSFAYPAVMTNSKYIFAYDLGGGTNSLRIFNTYTRLYSYTYDSPIWGISVNEDGAFAVIAADKGYSSGFRVYDSDNRIIYSKQYGDTHVVSVGIDRTASRVLVVTVNSGDGDYNCEIFRYRTNFEDPINNIKYLGEMPIKVKYFQDNSFVFLTDSALRFFTEDCTLKNEIKFNDMSVKRYFFGQDYAIITYATQTVGNSTRLAVLNGNGEEILSEYFEGDILGAAKVNNKVYVLTDNELHTIDIINGNTDIMKIDESYSVLSVSEDHILLSSESGAVIIATAGQDEAEPD